MVNMATISSADDGNRPFGMLTSHAQSTLLSIPSAEHHNKLFARVLTMDKEAVRDRKDQATARG